MEPAPEFTKLAITQLETRNLTQQVVESWKPIVANALNEWAKQRMLTAALTTPQVVQPDPKPDAGKIETTEEELAAFASVVKLLGNDCPVAYEDSVAYFKIHMVERRTWVIARLLLDRKNPQVWVPLPLEVAKPLAGERPVSTNNAWSIVTLESSNEISNLGALFFEAYSYLKKQKTSGDAVSEA